MSMRVYAPKKKENRKKNGFSHQNLGYNWIVKSLGWVDSSERR